MTADIWLPEPRFKPAVDRGAAEVAIDAAGATDTGFEREHNEDQFLVAELRRAMRRSSSVAQDGWALGGAEGTLLCVSDGVAGLAGGEIASAIAVDAVERQLFAELPWLPPGPVPSTGERVRVRAAMEVAFHNAHRTMKCGDEPMAATLTAAFVLWPALYLAHVGDSRCYLARGGELVQVTRDHTIAEVMRARGLTPDEELDDMLWNTLGGQECAPEVDFERIELAEGDRVLLCSDGLVKHVSDARIAEILAAEASSVELCRRLVDDALHGGGSDNVTVALLQARRR